MLLSRRVLLGQQEDVRYQVTTALHSRYRILIQELHGLSLDGSAFTNRLPLVPCARSRVALPLSGLMVAGTDERVLCLRPGEWIAEQVGGGSYVSYTPGVCLFLEWDEGSLGSSLEPMTGGTISAKALSLLRREAFALGRSQQDALLGATIVERILRVLHEEGLPLDRREDARELIEALPPWMALLSERVDAALSNLGSAALLDLEESLGWSVRKIRMRMGELRAHFGYETTGWRQILNWRRLIGGAILMSEAGVTAEQVAGRLGYHSPGSFYTALDAAGLPAPGKIRELSRCLQ